MKYTTLPNTDIRVSKICLGTMTFGEQNTEKEAHEQLSFALDHGVNFLDTAELYAVPSTKENNGLTEDFIGNYFRDTGSRDQWIVATKVAGPANGRSYIAENLGFSKGRILHAVNRSLRRLQTDYIDLYQLHWPERNANIFGNLDYIHDENESWQDNISEVVTIMGELVQSGKIRHWGLSNETPWGTMRFLAEADRLNLPRPITIQNPYHLMNRSYEIGMAEVTHRENLGLLAYSPLAMGVLSGKYNLNTASEGARLKKYKYFSRYVDPRVLGVSSKYLTIAQDHGMSLTQMALAYVNTRSFLTANIIGATTIAQLKENIESIDIILNNDIIAAIQEIHQAHSNVAP